jgi:hypothetical protein
MYRRIKIEMRLLISLFILAVVVDTYSIYQATNGISNTWLLHIYTPIEYGILVMVFSFWQKNALAKKILRLSIPVFVVIFMANKLLLENFHYFDHITSSIEGIALIAISAFTLIYLPWQNPVPIHRSPRFWVASAVIIYFSGTILTFSLSALFVIWYIPTVLNLVANIVYTGGFLCQPYQLN